MTIDECRVKTQAHIEKVRKYIRYFTDRLTTRGVQHDSSKLETPEIELFAEHTDDLNNITYGSQEYMDKLEALRPALTHHYANNRHHPEYFNGGVNDMNLIDIVEMLCDWKAASERQSDGNLLKSIEINIKRFNIDEQMAQVLINTARLLEDIE